MGRFTHSLVGALVTGATIAAVSALPGPANAFPDREIRVIVPWNPGGSTDIMARTIQPILEKQGVRMVVENLPGGGSAVGVGQLVTSKPDGYTVCLASSSILALIAQNQVPFKAKDMTNIVRFSEDPLLLVESGQSEIKTIEDFMANLKSKPGEVTIATPGSKNVNHALAVSAGLAAGVDFRHVPYPGGSRVVAELMGGQIQAGVLKPSETIEQIKAGDLRALAVFRDQRLDVLPDVPTFAEKGFNVFPFGKVAQITFMVAPKGIDPKVRETLASIFQKAALSPEFQAFAKKSGFLSDGLAGAELDSYVTELSSALDQVAAKAFAK